MIALNFPKHGDLNQLSITSLNYSVKPWLFKDWVMDIIGKITPPSSKHHEYILVATDLFTK